MTIEEQDLAIGRAYRDRRDARRELSDLTKRAHDWAIKLRAAAHRLDSLGSRISHDEQPDMPEEAPSLRDIRALIDEYSNVASTVKRLNEILAD